MSKKCPYCHRQMRNPAMLGSYPDGLDATRDHTTPRHMLTSGDYEHILLVCRRCNTLKGGTPPEVFEKYISLYGEVGLNNHRAYRIFCYHLLREGLDRVDRVTVLVKLKAHIHVRD